MPIFDEVRGDSLFETPAKAEVRIEVDDLDDFNYDWNNFETLDFEDLKDVLKGEVEDFLNLKK